MRKPKTTINPQQAALIDFLRADLELSFTLLRTAGIEAMDDPDPEGCRSALEKVKAALVTIRRYEGRITDSRVCSEIHARANELESALGAFPSRPL